MRRRGCEHGAMDQSPVHEISEAEWDKKKGEWLPSEADYSYVQSLMKPVTEPGKFANYIAPPIRGINRLPIAYEYVRTEL